MTSMQIIYLEIHSKKDGNKTFRASVRYDWYIMQNCKCEYKTIIRDEKYNMNYIDLRIGFFYRIICLKQLKIYWMIM